VHRIKLKKFTGSIYEALGFDIRQADIAGYFTYQMSTKVKSISLERSIYSSKNKNLFPRVLLLLNESPRELIGRGEASPKFVEKSVIGRKRATRKAFRIHRKQSEICDVSRSFNVFP